MQETNEINNKKGRGVTKRFHETAFIFPFSYEGGQRNWKKHFESQELENYWVKSQDIYSKHFLKHILNDENKPFHYEMQAGLLPACNHNGIMKVESVLNKKKMLRTYEVIVIGLSLFVFPTGIGFITLRVKYPENTEIGEIADFSADFSRIIANEMGVAESRVGCKIGDSKFLFTEFLNQIVGKTDENKITFFPCTNGKRAFVFQRISGDCVSGIEKRALKNNLWIDSREVINDVTEICHDLEVANDRYCMFSPTTMCVVSKEIEGTEEEIRRRENNVRFSYFNLYLLCIHEYQALILYNQKKVLIGKKFGASRKIKQELLRFLPAYSFDVISIERSYQEVYLTLKKILFLEEMEESLKDNISMLEAAYVQKRDDIVNIVLAFISVLGLVSVVIDVITALKLI